MLFVPKPYSMCEEILMNTRGIAVFGIIVLLAATAFCVDLTDPQLYLDPAGLELDFYPIINLPDLSLQNSYIWPADGDDIIDADILPILKPGQYPHGYSYSQSDYLQTPNVDYFADLTAGTLTATFLTPGLYHIRIIRTSGAQQTYALYAQAFLKGGKAGKSGTSKKVDPVPNGDLFLVEQPDDTMDDSAKVWENNGRTVQRASSKQDVVNKIKAKSKALGRKIHVELDGHGNKGQISLGTGNDTNHQLTLKNVAEFQKSIDDYVNHITFQGCSIGAGKKGKRFLQILADSIGKAGAWDADVTVVDANYFTVPTGAKFVEIEVKDKKDIQYNIPVVVNCVGPTDSNTINEMIKKANKKLEGANIALRVKQVNKNVPVGDANDTLNFDEIWDLRSQGKKELVKVIKNKKGKWTGKGLKIYVANTCQKEKPQNDNWAWRHNRCVGVNRTIDPNKLADLVKRYYDPNKLSDPNYTDRQIAEMHAEAEISASAMTLDIKQLKPSGYLTTAEPTQRLRLEAGIVDNDYDTTGAPDPFDPTFGYADIQDVTLNGSGLSDPNGQTTIRITLNGTFPGTEPNPYTMPNPERPFDAIYTLHILDHSLTDTGMITMRIWSDQPETEYNTLAWYEGINPAYIGSLIVLDNQLLSWPEEIGEPNAILTQTLELVVSNQIFFGYAAQPFYETANLSCDSIINDGGFTIFDIAEDLDGPTFELPITTPTTSPKIHIAGPSLEYTGKGIAVTGNAFTPGLPVDITIDDIYIDTCTPDDFGDFLYFIDYLATAEALELQGTHQVLANQTEIIADTTNYSPLSVTFEYQPTEPIPGDIDGDDDVDAYDFAILANNWLVGTE